MAYEANVSLDALLFTGEDKSLAFTVYDPDSTPSSIYAGTAAKQDITGWSLGWMVKRNKTDPDSDALIVKTMSDGIAITNGAGGACRVVVNEADIAELVGGLKYHHELKRLDAGFRSVLSFGIFIANQAVHGNVEAS